MSFIRNNLGGSGGSENTDIVPEHYGKSGTYTTSGVSTANLTATATKDGICSVILCRAAANTSSSVNFYVKLNGVAQTSIAGDLGTTNRARYKYYSFDVKEGDEVVAYNSSNISQYGANRAYILFV